MNGNYHGAHYDETTGGIVVSEIDPSEFDGAEVVVRGGNWDARVQRALSSWAEDAQGTDRNRKGIFGRDKFVTPTSVLKQLEVASVACKDDIVSNYLDASESIAFHKMRFEVTDKDQEYIWNQIARDLDLDSFIREAWRDLNTYSHMYCAITTGVKTFKVPGKTNNGNARRKSYEVMVPTSISTVDPLRVVPVNKTMSGTQSLAWIASPAEDTQWIERMNAGLLPPSPALYKYEPPESEKEELEKHDVPVDRLWVLNPDIVFAHTLTKQSYERWAEVRLASIFPLLDLKEQLRDMDRAWLLGGVNFIVLVKRGGPDKERASAQEIEATGQAMRTQSKSPVIVTDHRIEIEIITPDIEHVLSRSKWDVLDSRLLMRLWSMIALPSEMGRESNQSMAAVVIRGLASRRHMLKRMMERVIIRPVMDADFNDGKLTEDAKIQFSPRRMELESDPQVVSMLQSLRDRGDISRETILSEFNFDQSMEAERREYEDKAFKDVFTPVNVPHDAKDGTTPDGSGRAGGGRPPGVVETAPRKKEVKDDA